jgi:hypothetical protein
MLVKPASRPKFEPGTFQHKSLLHEPPRIFLFFPSSLCFSSSLQICFVPSFLNIWLTFSFLFLSSLDFRPVSRFWFCIYLLLSLTDWFIYSLFLSTTVPTYSVSIRKQHTINKTAFTHTFIRCKWNKLGGWGYYAIAGCMWHTSINIFITQIAYTIPTQPTTNVHVGNACCSQHVKSSTTWFQANFITGLSEARRHVLKYVMTKQINNESIIIIIVQTSSGADPASHPMGNGGSFTGGKAEGAWSLPLVFN